MVQRRLQRVQEALPRRARAAGSPDQARAGNPPPRLRGGGLAACRRATAAAGAPPPSQRCHAAAPAWKHYKNITLGWLQVPHLDQVLPTPTLAACSCASFSSISAHALCFTAAISRSAASARACHRPWTVLGPNTLPHRAGHPFASSLVAPAMQPHPPASSAAAAPAAAAAGHPLQPARRPQPPLAHGRPPSACPGSSRAPPAPC